MRYIQLFICIIAGFGTLVGLQPEFSVLSEYQRKPKQIGAHLIPRSILKMLQHPDKSVRRKAIEQTARVFQTGFMYTKDRHHRNLVQDLIVHILQHPHQQVRRGGLKALQQGIELDKRPSLAQYTIPVIQEHLKTGSPSEKKEILRFIGQSRLADRSLEPQLRQLLQSKSEEVRLYAAIALDKRHRYVTIQASLLLQAAESNDWYVDQWLWKNTHHISSRETRLLWKALDSGDLKKQKAVLKLIQYLRKRATPAIPLLLKFLKEKKPRPIQYDAFIALLSINDHQDTTFPTVKKWIKRQKTPIFGRWILNAILTYPKYKHFFHKYLYKNYRKIYRGARRNLTSYLYANPTDPTYINLLRLVLKDPVIRVYRRTSCTAPAPHLGTGLLPSYQMKRLLDNFRLLGSKAFPLWLEAMKDKSPAVRSKAILGLVALKTKPQATEKAVGKMMKDQHPKVTFFATFASFMFHGFQPIQDWKKIRKNTYFKRFTKTLLNELENHPKHTHPLLLEILKDKDKVLRIKAAHLLWKQGYQKAHVLQIFRLALQSRNDVENHQAIRSIQELAIKRPNIVDLMIKRLSTPSASTRLLALQVLVEFKIANSLVLQALLKEANHSTRWNRSQAIYLLAKLKYTEDDFLGILFRDIEYASYKRKFNERVLEAAIFVLGDLPLSLQERKRVTSLLSTFIRKRQDPYDRNRRAYTLFAQVAYPRKTMLSSVIYTLRDEKMDDFTVRSLKQLKRPFPELLPHLLKKLPKAPSKLKRAILLYIERTGGIDVSAAPTLLYVLEDKSAKVRLSTIRTLALLKKHPLTLPKALKLRLQDRNKQVRKAAKELLESLQR